LKLLIVKLSSLGDVVHAMAALQDIRSALGGDCSIDWVVERAFAPLVRRCAGVQRVIGCEIRRWRKTPWRAQTRAEWRAFLAELRDAEYDAVIDLQGLTKSAVVARLARLAPGGKRYGLANRTEGSSFEAPARWLTDVAIRIEPHTHVVQRGRELCARALGFRVQGAPRFGLGARALAPAGPVAAQGRAQAHEPALPPQPFVLLAHGASRADKLWPEACWIELGARVIEEGNSVALAHGTPEEEARSQRIARALGRQAMAWPRLELDILLDRMARARGVVGVDSGLSHIAVALDLPHVQIYNFDTAWRTGPLGAAHQLAVVARSPLAPPSVDQVWALWQQALRA
jgi:heptosyltransferase-1